MERTALLVMDVQNGIVERVAGQSAQLLATLGTATAAARDHGITVVYVRVAFRDGAVEVSPRNRAFSALAGATSMGVEDAATQVHPGVAPHGGDVVVVKKRVSAFTGSDLEVVLRATDVSSLVLCGIATSGVVLSTLRQAADLDFDLTVLADGCADADPEVHRVLLEKVFPRQAAVVTTADWVGGLG
jgi:nicotinamidase-related amidase